MDERKRQLNRIFSNLDDASRRSLLDFAQYLDQRENHSDQLLSETSVVDKKQQPIPQPRPDNENVFKAIKRLRATYYMLNTDVLVNEASSLTSQFILQGREAVDVIDDLEKLFDSHYQKYLES